MNASLCRDNTLASPTPEKRHWDFPNLEIPDAPLHHGGAPFGIFSVKKSPRLLYTTEERHWDPLCQEIPEAPPHHGGDLLGHTLREGQQQVLVCARSRPTSTSVL